jgi:serine phosphatase RsbU (regulator of sigma subunit)
MIGDVTGKGVAAAAVTSLVRHTAWSASEVDPTPTQILRRIDSALRRRPSLSVCTALCLRLSGSRATIALGGHPPALCVSEQGVREVGCHGTLLGAFAETSRPKSEFELSPGETLFAFTDGVTDAIGADGERFGFARLKDVLEKTKGDSPAKIRGRLVSALEDFQVGAQADDTAVVVMRYTGQRSTSSAVGVAE